MSTATLNNAKEATQTSTDRCFCAAAGTWMESIGRHAIRYGLVLVLVWIGAMKFTAYEAEGISGLVANSPLLSWAYQVFSTRQFSAFIGVTELCIAGLIALRPLSPRASAAGGALAVGMFLTTLSFLVSTPDVVEPSVGVPGLSVLPNIARGVDHAGPPFEIESMGEPQVDGRFAVQSLGPQDGQQKRRLDVEHLDGRVELIAVQVGIHSGSLCEWKTVS